MLQPLPPTAVFSDPDHDIFCGSAVNGDDGKCHMFHSRWAGKLGHFAQSCDSCYQINRLPGRGGMGAVYEGFATRLDRRVAIKILPAETSSGALLRFEREAKATAAHLSKSSQTGSGHGGPLPLMSLHAFTTTANIPLAARSPCLRLVLWMDGVIQPEKQRG